MQTLAILILIMFVGMYPLYAGDRKEAIKDMVKEAVEEPKEYEIPQDVLGVMQNFQVSFQTWNTQIENHNKVIALMEEKIKVCQAHQAHDGTSIKHTLRTYLASMGVPLADLGNWKPEGNKAVRKQPKLVDKPPDTKE